MNKKTVTKRPYSMAFRIGFWFMFGFLVGATAFAISYHYIIH